MFPPNNNIAEYFNSLNQSGIAANNKYNMDLNNSSMQGIQNLSMA
jgi:hypothetical protein